MLHKSYLLTILAAFTLVFSSCSKDDKDDPEPTLEAQISQKTWLLDDHEVLFDGEDEPTNVYDLFINAVGTDDIAFKLDGKGEYMIYLDGEEEENGDYQLEDDKLDWEYPLTFSYGASDGEDNDFKVKLNGSTLTLTGEGTDPRGIDFKETITFKVK
ncbi:hypothetical protein [Rufibacter aurantiacus]|uniref:hypothetical protein n=1 Tax=Rufibacter aurantiacus TaxID=2817374 RepID=UPI001B316CE9|nr:hypothetical protein [Rufibacter aurantiacus]